MQLPNHAIDAARDAGDSFGLELTSPDIQKLLEAAAPLIAAQALREAADCVITPGALSVAASWLRDRADKLEARSV